jgi:hypothetical protein
MRQHVGSFYEKWGYFLLPEGTSVPAGLDVALTPTKNDPKHHDDDAKRAFVFYKELKQRVPKNDDLKRPSKSPSTTHHKH